MKNAFIIVAKQWKVRLSEYLGNAHTSRGICNSVYAMSNTHTSRGTCILYGKHAYIMGNVHISCQTRIHHGECAYLMANTHKSRGTCILYGKHAHIMGNVYISLGKVDDKQMCVELNKAVLWINRHTCICYTKYTARGCEEIRDSFNYVKIAFVWLIVYKYVSG